MVGPLSNSRVFQEHALRTVGTCMSNALAIYNHSVPVIYHRGLNSHLLLPPPCAPFPKHMENGRKRTCIQNSKRTGAHTDAHATRAAKKYRVMHRSNLQAMLCPVGICKMARDNATGRPSEGQPCCSGAGGNHVLGTDLPRGHRPAQPITPPS